MKLIANRTEEISNPYYVENAAEKYYKKTKDILEQGVSVLKEFYNVI